MDISFDPKKNERNIATHGLSFERAAEFDFATASYDVDDRREYGETRYTAVGFLGERLHVLCFVDVADGIRVISFRKANQREVRNYAKTQATD